eukprot:TRINITY_DN20049_c0_g1_i1.p1 TRINITY_DN20049_c0_g1~~TRINITY_DN20049_c0_g1_i1.p1  ORF type:complete len:291 (+),score=96.75 TRINITY_DN20049_c0_g1_i1:83-874(+)
MVQRRFALLLAGLCAAALITSARAQEGDDEAEQTGGEAEEDDEEEAGSKVRIDFFMPQHTRISAEPRIPAGEEVDALIHMSVPDDHQPQNVQFIQARVAALGQPEVVIQNLTGGFYNRTIGAGESATLVYRFKTARELEPRDYSFAVLVYYVDPENMQPMIEGHPAYNGTCTIVDATSGLDMQMLGLTVVLGFLGFLIWTVYQKRGKRRSRHHSAPKPAAAPAATTAGGTPTKASAGYDEDWIPKSHRRPSGGQRRSGSRDGK